MIEGLMRWMRRRLRGASLPGVNRAAVCSPLVGVVAGLGAVGFLLALKAMQHYVLADWMHMVPPPTGEDLPRAIQMPWPWWMVLLIPTAGGLISGFLVFTFAPEAEGHGTDAMIRSFHRKAGQVRARVPLVKSIASVITIGTGGSAGQEGPIAQIGAGFGSLLGRMLRLSSSERRIVMLAGAAGGVGAIFRAPLGGALFAGEVLYRSTATEGAALLPCLASSIVAYSVFALFVTPEPIFAMPPLQFHGFRELPVFALLAVACSLAGWFYVRMFYGIRDRVFAPMPLPRTLKPAIGGLATGLIALALPQVLGGGYGWVQWGAIGLPARLLQAGEAPFSPALTVGMLLALAAAKVLATGLTISSGGSGGVFGPSLFIGGMIGGAFGQVATAVLPEAWQVEPAACTLVGMGGFFAGVSKTPLTSIVMVCEMTGSYALLVPLMMVCTLNVALSRGWTLYEEQVVGPADSPAHQGEYLVDLLKQILVADVAVRTQGLERIGASTPLVSILPRVAGSVETVFPVVADGDPGRLVGLFSLGDLRLALTSRHLDRLVLAGDLATLPAPCVTPADDLRLALRRMTELGLGAIPVVAADDPERLLGLLDHKTIDAAYGARLLLLSSTS
jgi:CIC family chloride channel protein